jgi:hypothetical protein
MNLTVMAYLNSEVEATRSESAEQGGGLNALPRVSHL